MTNRMNRRGMLMVMGGLALVGLVAAAPGDAGVDSNRTTQLTFSKPFSLPGVTLGAGTYIFERAAPQSAIEVVRVSSQCRSHRSTVQPWAVRSAAVPASHSSRACRAAAWDG